MEEYRKILTNIKCNAFMFGACLRRKYTKNKKPSDTIGEGGFWLVS